MGYVLLWLESLAFPLLLLAATMAWTAQLKPYKVHRFVQIPGLVAVCFAALAAVAFSLENHVRHSTLLDFLPLRWDAISLLILAGGLWATRTILSIWLRIILFICLAYGCLVFIHSVPWFESGLTHLAAASLAVTLLVWSLCKATRLVGIVLVIVIAVIPFTAFAAVTIIIPRLYFCTLQMSVQFWAMLSLTLAYAAAGTGLLTYGWSPQIGHTMVRTSNWPLAKLASSVSVVAVLWLATLWGLDAVAWQEVAAIRDEARALALSVSPLRVPDADNAAILYQQAFALMRPWPDPSIPPPLSGDGKINNFSPSFWDDKKWMTWLRPDNPPINPHDPELQSYLKQQQPAIAMLRHAAAMPGCNFYRDDTRHQSTLLLPELHLLRDAADLLGLDAVVRAARGDCQGALRNVSTIFRIAEHVANEPFFVTLDMAVQIDRRAIRALVHALTSKNLPAAELEGLKVPETLSYRFLLKRALLSEDMLSLSCLEDLCSGRPSLWYALAANQSPYFVPWAFPSVYRNFLFQADLAEYRQQAAGRAVLLQQSPYPELKKALSDAEERTHENSFGPFSRSCSRRLEGFLETIVTGDSQRWLAKVGLAAYRHRIKNGKYPENLDELCPGFLPFVPLDPFNEKPIRIKKTEKGLVLYCVGPDLADDDGKPFDESTRNGDITFQLPPLTAK